MKLRKSRSSESRRRQQGCQIFLATTHQNGKKPIPNYHKIYQIATKYIKIAAK
jgi:hypothetical protein